MGRDVESKVKGGSSAAQASGDLPLHELAALEAVARLGSVQRAADALHVTASAISHRIASLQRRAGQALLQRAGRGVALTATGQAYVAAVQAGLMAFGESTRQLRDHEHCTVRIATAAAIGIEWLLPRLREHLREHPDIQLDIRTVATAQAVSPARWDLMVHIGNAPLRGSERVRIRDEQLVTVVASGSGEDERALCLRRELRLAQLNDAGRAQGAWVAASSAPAQAVFDDALTMLELAAAGGGFARTTQTAAARLARAGRLREISAPLRIGAEYAMDLSEAGQRKAAARALFHALAPREAPA